jgi:hypothetical protein
MRRVITPPPIGSREELIVRNALRNHHRGEGLAVPKHRILAWFARQPAPARRLDRRELDEMLRQQRAAGFPVCATAAGVFWAATRAEIFKARAYVLARIPDLRETCEAYDRLAAAWGRPLHQHLAPSVRQELLFAAPQARRQPPDKGAEP